MEEKDDDACYVTSVSCLLDYTTSAKAVKAWYRTPIEQRFFSVILGV